MMWSILEKAPKARLSKKSITAGERSMNLILLLNRRAAA